MPKNVNTVDEEILYAAIDEVTSGRSSIRRAAIKYGVPKSTLQRRVKNPYPKRPLKRCQSSRKSLLAEEDDLVNCIIVETEWGEAIIEDKEEVSLLLEGSLWWGRFLGNVGWERPHCNIYILRIKWEPLG